MDGTRRYFVSERQAVVEENIFNRRQAALQRVNADAR